MKAYQIYRDSIDDKNLIGNLELDVIEAIHGDNITDVDHENRIVLVKRTYMKKVCTGCRQSYRPIMSDDGDCCPSCARY